MTIRTQPCAPYRSPACKPSVPNDRGTIPKPTSKTCRSQAVAPQARTANIAESYRRGAFVAPGSDGSPFAHPIRNQADGNGAPGFMTMIAAPAPDSQSPASEAMASISRRTNPPSTIGMCRAGRTARQQRTADIAGFSRRGAFIGAIRPGEVGTDNVAALASPRWLVWQEPQSAPRRLERCQQRQTKLRPISARSKSLSHRRGPQRVSCGRGNRFGRTVALVICGRWIGGLSSPGKSHESCRGSYRSILAIARPMGKPL